VRAINHALTGTLIGLTVAEPAVAVPLAFVSHYVCDMIPHYDLSLPTKQKIRSKQFHILLGMDVILCLALVLILSADRPANWILAAACAFVAAAPDFFSFGQYRNTLRSKRWKDNSYTRFAKDIQWFERPIGGLVEVAWFIAAVLLVLPFLR